MKPSLPPAATLLAAALALAACGGGGSSMTGGPGTPPGSGTPPDLSDDPRVARLGALLERADALLMTGLHTRWSLAAEGEGPIEDAFVDGVSCSGARCVAADGTATAARDLLDPSGGVDPGGAEATIGERGGSTR